MKFKNFTFLIALFVSISLLYLNGATANDFQSGSEKNLQKSNQKIDLIDNGMSLKSGEVSNGEFNFESVLDRVTEGGNRIVGGDNVNILDYPWQISLQYVGYGHFCGGTIVDAEWIVTASHCVVDEENNVINPSQIRIRAGFTLMNSTDGSYHNIAEVIAHPEYDANGYDHDIALLRLSNPIDLSHPAKAAVPYVTMEEADNGLTDPGVMTKVSGWGALYSGGPAPNQLQAIDVPIVDVSNTSYPPSNITADMLIAGATGMDACQGDSGGPLVIFDGKTGYKLAGVVSWGVGCGASGYPGVYARVSYFESWLNENIIFLDPNQYAVAYYEDFSDGGLPVGWTNNVIEGPVDFPGWEWTTTGGAYGGQLNSTSAENGYLILDSDAHGAENVAEEADLITPAYDFTEVTSPIFFSAEHFARTFGAADISIYITTDDFATQTELYRWNNAPQNQTNGPNPVRPMIDITEFAQGQSNVKFKFKWIGSYDYWWLVDDMRILFQNPLLTIQFNATDGTNPLQDVEINTIYFGQNALTDINGIAYIELYEAQYEIYAEKDGYYPYEAIVSIVEDGQIVNIIMEKIPAPEIVVLPESIAIDVKQGFTNTATFNISNPGDADLEFSIYAFEKQPERSFAFNGITAHYEGFEVSEPFERMLFVDEKITVNQPEQTRAIGDPVELLYDGGPESGLGTNGAASWISAVRFTEAELSEYYNDFELNQVKLHIRTNQFSAVTVKVWEGGSLDGPGTEIYSQSITTDVVVNNWTIHELAEGITLKQGMEYWIGYAITATGGYPSSTDDGPMVPEKGGWMYFNGVWALLPDINAALNYNWCVRGIINQVEGADWISFDITEEVVKPLDDIDIEITFNAAGLDLGNYYADVLIVNNTGENVIIPVTMTVIPATFDVEFVIIDNLGDPVVDAVVQLDEITNDPGVYLFEAIALGAHPYTVTKAGFYTASGTAYIVDGNIIITLKLIPEGSVVFNVSVSIVDEFLAVVENALFSIDNIGTFLSDQNGEISFIALEDTYSYSVSKYGFEIIEDVIIVDQDKPLDITMIYLRYNLTLIANPEIGGTFSGDGIYYHGETATVNAVPAEFYNFLSWKKNGVIVSEIGEYVFDVMQNTELTAHFELFRYNITATADPIAGGVINGTGEYFHGDPVTLSASPASGYQFVKWTEDEIEIAEAGAVYTFNAYEDRDLVAHFELKTYTLTFSVKDQSGSPILDANITFDGDTYDAGVYVFNEILPGTYPYVVTKQGYFDKSGNVTISNSNKTQNVVLEIDNTNIEDIISEEFSVYPNPFSDLLNVKSEELITEIIVFDIAGRKMIQVLPSDINVEINMNNLRTGVYFVKIIGINTTTTIKIQKQ